MPNKIVQNMFSVKERRKKITACISLTKQLDQWLKMSIDELGLLFGFSVRTYNTLNAVGFRSLKDILLFSRKGLTEGTGMTIAQFKKLSTQDTDRILRMEIREGAKELHVGTPTFSRKDATYVEGIDYINPENIRQNDLLLNRWTVLVNRRFIEPASQSWNFTPAVMCDLDRVLDALGLELQSE